MPITGIILQKLRECKEYYDMLSKDDSDFDDCGAIYCYTNGKPAFPHYLNKLLKKCLLEANCHIVTCHKLRHGWITDMIDNGAKIPLVSRLAGHATPEITLRVYTHYRKDTDNSIEVLDKMYGKYVYA